MKNLKIAFLGTPQFVEPIRVNLDKHFQLVNSLKDADLGIVAAFGQILSKEELEAPKYGCINIHPSLLPYLRGSSPIQTAILNGDEISGITIIKMDQEVDHGPIIYQDRLELSSSDNFDTLSKKMFLQVSSVLPQVIIDFISGKITPIPQDHSKASYTKHFTKENGYFDLPAGGQVLTPKFLKKLDRMIRAYHPWPGVWTRWNSKIIKLLPNQILQMEGKKPIPLKDFLNGYPDFPLKSI